MPGKRLVLGDEDVRVTIAVEIHKSKIPVASISVKLRAERPKYLPTISVISFIETGARSIKHHEIELTVTCKIHELGCTTDNGCVWFCGDKFCWRELRTRTRDAMLIRFQVKLCKIAFEEPALSL